MLKQLVVRRADVPRNRNRFGLAFTKVLLVTAGLIPNLITSVAQATWSIALADSKTKEVAVGTVTCLTQFDLMALVPVVVVGKGAGAVQAAGDFDGIRRPVLFNGLRAAKSPFAILFELSQIPGHQDRQYGIADTQQRSVTFTGSGNGQFAGGVTGRVGTLQYAIQGNVLAGSCVINAIEQAIINTVGDVPEKLMAGMRAARDNGGDGRCSCLPAFPDGCGCPPPSFTKPGHIGGVAVARIGNTDDPSCNINGCADGQYYWRESVAFQTPILPDPVAQLQDRFMAFRAATIGEPDGIQSVVTLDHASLPPDGTSTTTMHISLLDWQKQPVDGSTLTVTVSHAADSAGLSTIGPVTFNSGGDFSVPLQAGNAIGTDRFRIKVVGGFQLVVLMPEPELRFCSDAACDDGLFCNGAETCDAAGQCQPGTPVNPDDGIACTDDSCNEVSGVINVPNNSVCDNGLFCDGSEICDPVLDCQPGSNPCPGQLCDEATQTCADCFSTADCDDGNPCNGAETCNASGVCEAGSITDCNNNGVADSCDVANDPTSDTNGNGIPDVCEVIRVPVVSQWGLIILTLILLIGAKVRFGAYRPSRR